jgi:hypothetical protein
VRDPATHWHPAAAYLYVLHLDGPALAWEYLRRNPDYRLDWHQQLDRRTLEADAAPRWGLRLLEDPDRDSRDAEPDWIPEPDTVVLVRRDDDPPEEALPFHLWRYPGHKQLTHDGRRLTLTCQLVGRTVRLAIASNLEDGMPHTYAVRAGERRLERTRALEAQCCVLEAEEPPAISLSRPRPTRDWILHMRALQALDGTIAGASQRQVAEVLFGWSTVAERWSEDSDLRARVRRLTRRGQAYMSGRYRRLLRSS